MYGTILVPLDGSALAERALPFAQIIAQAAGARLLLLRVVAAPEAPGKLGLPEPDKTIADAEAYLAGLVPYSAVEPPVETAAFYGKPANLIVGETQARAAGLIVMSTHGRSGLGAWVYGSVAGEILRRVEVPVLAIPRDCRADWSERRPSRVVVPLDGSDLAREALVPATDLARLLGAELVLLRVVVPALQMAVAGSPVPVPAPMPAPDVRRALGALSSIAAELREAGLVVATEVIEGDNPASIITTTPSDGPADAIVMATHGRTGIARLVMGSVATGVVSQATVPVLLVRPVALPAPGNLGD